MAISITIAGTTIEVPNTSENPNWGPAMVAFFKAVESGFNISIGPYDIPLQVYNIDGGSFNPTTSIQNIVNLSFATSVVRAGFVTYSVYRQTDSTAVAEAGNIVVVYNSNSGTWNLSQDKAGDAQITFSIDNTGQVQFTTTALAGINHTGKITFSARALTNS